MNDRIRDETFFKESANSGPVRGESKLLKWGERERVVYCVVPNNKLFCWFRLSDMREDLLSRFCCPSMTIEAAYDG